eukprot:c19728_g1_i1 orf=64-642(+)
MRVSAKAIKHLWRKFYNYLRYDFKEIVSPSALPDPPGTETARKPTWDDHVFVWRTATKIFLKSFTTRNIDIDEEFELIKNPDKVRSKKDKKTEPAEPSTIEDLAVAARAGSEHIRPALQRIYMTKASSYRDALQNFVEGYKEGLTEVLNSDNTTSETGPNDTPSGTTPEGSTGEVKPDIKASDMKQAHSSKD